MGNYFDLHRHDETSFFDGYGKPKELAKVAKSLGYQALGISNHGNITGLVQHWQACKEVGIKPVMGCEVYFQPKFNKENPERKTYHLCLFVKNMEGYKNLCHMLTEANREQFYYKAVIDFGLLEKYSSGLICSTACIAGPVSVALTNGKKETAQKLIRKFKSLFGKDFYVEIQPYRIDKEGTQERVNLQMMGLAKQNKVKCILTSDSHYGRKEDFDTYCKMHEIGRTTLDVKNTYQERYMPSESEILERFAKMYAGKMKDPYSVAERFVDNLKEIYDKVEPDILSECQLVLPKLDIPGKTSAQVLKSMVQKGLKQKGQWNSEYKKRCLEELDVIHYHGFDDYFLIVQDYVSWARKQGIAVGPGRGSACNCLVAYAIGITEVDSIKYNLDFSRFMRKDKKKLPDIDVDFETARRQEVIDYVIQRYPGKSVQICSYGEWTVDGLINDLAKVCGLPTSGKELDEWDKEENKKKVAELKRFVHSWEVDGVLNTEQMLESPEASEYNERYDNIIRHFCRLHGKIRYLGKHAAGVAVVGSDISDYTCLVRKVDGKKVTYSSCYDLNDLEHINCTKFDMLGLKTMSELLELEQLTGHKVTEKELEEPEIFDSFREGRTDGIFQMEKSAPKKILKQIHCDCMADVVAVNALNRPAPLQLKMHETYAYNKLSGHMDKNTPFYQYTSETYGTMLYQEQTVEVAQKVGHLSVQQSFDLLKIMKKAENLTKPEYVPIIEQMRKDFFGGCKQEGLTVDETKTLWASMLIYGFNKGHSVGYAIIAVRQMWYKLHYPAVFWYTKMKYAGNEADLAKYSEKAVKDGAVVMLPHVNYTADTSMRKYDGEHVIQQGLNIIKGVGDKAARAIEEERKAHGVFHSYDDFYDRCKGRTVTSRVIGILEEQGALEFRKKRYMGRVVKYNSSLLGR